MLKSVRARWSISIQGDVIFLIFLRNVPVPFYTFQWVEYDKKTSKWNLAWQVGSAMIYHVLGIKKNVQESKSMASHRSVQGLANLQSTSNFGTRFDVEIIDWWRGLPQESCGLESHELSQMFSFRRLAFLSQLVLEARSQQMKLGDLNWLRWLASLPNSASRQAKLPLLSG